MKTIEEFLASPDPPTVWICNPYVAQDGITFLHGRTSTGKSPLTWELARCVSLGLPFLGRWETTPRRVLYVEGDTPGSLVRPRLRALPEPVGGWWIEEAYQDGLDLANPGPKGLARLRGLYDACQPELVIWNTLRSLTRANLSSGETVAEVYFTLRHCFPGSAHVIVHHDRKISTSGDARHVPDEDHSGSGAWRDTAQIVLHLRTKGVGPGKWATVLEQTKTQGSEMMSPMHLTLAEDGTKWIPDDRKDRVAALWVEGKARCDAHEISDTATWVAEQLNISRATVFRIKGMAGGFGQAAYSPKPVSDEGIVSEP